MRRPRLTIAIPTVNRAALLRRAIDSALAQTYPDLEILVSDNGSTDDTPTVLERYSGTPRLRLCRRETTIPASEHGNFLIREARGELYIALSDDDWLEPEFAAKAVARFDGDPHVALVWTGCCIHYGDAVIQAKTGPPREAGTDFLGAFLAGSRNPCWCAIMSRTADLARLGPQPNDAICGDMFYWIKLAATGSVACVPEPLSHYVSYRDDVRNESSVTPVAAWANDTERWVRDILATCRPRLVGARSRRALERDAARFLARSTANQFIWNALRGARRADLARSVPRVARILLGGGLSPWLRVAAGLAAPRRLLQPIVIGMARRRSRPRPSKNAPASGVRVPGLRR